MSQKQAATSFQDTCFQDACFQERLVGVSNLADSKQNTRHTPESMHEIEDMAMTFLRERIGLAIQHATMDKRRTVTVRDVEAACAITADGFQAPRR